MKALSFPLHSVTRIRLYSNTRGEEARGLYDLA